MDKLQLHEVIGYVPFGLKSVSYFNCNEAIIGTVPITGIMNFCDASTSSQLLLRPFEDYYKEITVKGETFIPVDMMSKFVIGHCEHVNAVVKHNNGLPCVEFIPVTKNKIPFEYGFSNSMMMQKIYEWQIDFQGLIYRGHALDINKFIIPE